MNELREIDEDDTYYRDVVDEINHVLENLYDLGYPIETLDLEPDVFVDAQEHLSNKKNKGRVSFQTPKVAFYESDSIKSRTPMQKHASLEELHRHHDEMQRAYEQASQNPVWYGGNRSKRTGRR